MNKFAKFSNFIWMILLFVLIFRSYFRLCDLIMNHCFNLSEQAADQAFLVIVLIYFTVIFPSTLLLIRRWLDHQKR